MIQNYYIVLKSNHVVTFPLAKLTLGTRGKFHALGINQLFFTLPLLSVGKSVKL